jgi:hypothetical protein
MRLSCIASFALLAAAATPAAVHAQKQFEGRVVMEMAGDKGESRSMDTWVKGGKTRMEMSAEGRSFVMIADYAASSMLILIPQRKMYMEQPLPQGDDASAKVKVTRTGRRDVVAGHRCEIIRVEDEDSVAEICGASDMGRFVMGAGPGRAGSSWAKGLEGFFPLRVADGTGKVTLQVTKIERTAVADSQFLPPEGYTAMSMNLPGRR